MDIRTLVTKIKALQDCIVYKPTGIPKIENGHVLPNDLIQFYEICGGIDLYNNSEYPIVFLPPEKVMRANPIIIGDIPGIPTMEYLRVIYQKIGMLLLEIVMGIT